MATLCRLEFICCFLSIFCLFNVESTYPVAIFMWSRESSLSQSSRPLAGHTLSADEFQRKYLKDVLQKPQTVCLFVQDRLSVDDISRYGDAFTPRSYGSFNNLGVAMETANSSISLPSVEASYEGLSSGIISYIKSHIKGKFINVRVEDLDDFSVKDQMLDFQVTNVIVFHLHPVEISSADNAGLVFSQNDELIGSITKQIASVSPAYTCILMGDAPSKMIIEQQMHEEQAALPHDRLRRAVSDDDSANPPLQFANGTLFLNGECVFMNVGGMLVKAGNETAVDVFNTTTITGTVKSKCSNISDTSITATFKAGGLNAVLGATFNRTRGEWHCIEMSVSVKGSSATGVNVDLDKKFPCASVITVPMSMSYHCYNSTFVATNRTDSVQFLNFQVQPYGIKNNKFSYAYDCVGFFSIPILMGLVTVGVLLLILFFGIMVMFSITTMDRFDDPKGPGINIGSTQ